MDYDLPLLLSSLQKDKEWKSVDVSGSMIANPGVFNLKTNGLFIYLSSSTSNSNILFIPNYIAIPDPNARKPTAYLQCILIPKIRHTFVFSDQSQVMDFVNYIYKSNMATANFIKKVDITDYLVGDQISGIISPTNQKITELMIISQAQPNSIIFQAHIVNKDGVLPGISYTFSRNSFVSPIYDMPKYLKKEKDILTRSFTVFSIDNPNDMSIFITKNESEMIRIVMSFYVSIIYSSNLKQKSASNLPSLNSGDQPNPEILSENEMKNYRQRKESFIKKGLDDQCSFFEILEKMIFTEKVNPVSINNIQKTDTISFSQSVDYKSFLTQPSSENDLDISIPPEHDEDLEFNYDLITKDHHLEDENYSRFNFDYLQHQKKSSNFALIDQLGNNNNDQIKDIELIEKVLNNGIKNESKTENNDAWKVFCDISEKEITNNSNDELDYLIEVVNQLKNPDYNNELRTCKTLLQDLIRIGIEEKLLHIWILLTIPYKEIVQKYFNPESTFLDGNEINYCAFVIYNYIK